MVQPWHGEDLQAVIETALSQGAGEARDEGGRRGEQHAVAPLDGLEAEADGQVGLLDAGGPRMTRSAVRDEVQVLRVGAALSSEGW